VAPSLTGALRFVRPWPAYPSRWKVARTISARHALLADGNPRAKLPYSLRQQQANLYSQNLLTIATTGARRQHGMSGRMRFSGARIKMIKFPSRRCKNLRAAAFFSRTVAQAVHFFSFDQNSRWRRKRETGGARTQCPLRRRLFERGRVDFSPRPQVTVLDLGLFAISNRNNRMRNRRKP
jgi:hypothetical protein